MIDIHRLLTGLIQAIGSANFPDADALVAGLDMDRPETEITKSILGTICFGTTRLQGVETDIGVACGINPRRSIWLNLSHPSISYEDMKDEIFGADQQIEPSKYAAGFAVLFLIEGWNCGFTVSSPEANLQCLFCEEPKVKAAPIAKSDVPNSIGRSFAGPPPPRPAGTGGRQAFASCGELWQSDWHISHAAPFDYDHYHRGLLVKGALRRNRECLAGVKISYQLS